MNLGLSREQALYKRLQDQEIKREQQKEIIKRQGKELTEK